MPEDDGRIARLAAAVLDGTPVDWTAAESEADSAGLPLVQHLRAVAALAEVHRTRTPALATPSAQAETTLESWGHLRIVERIGSGTFGDVYRAWDTRLDREVAVKLLPADRAVVDRTASSIIHEGRLLARVRHPNVATIYGAEQIGDRIGLWMEFVRGRTLEQMLEQGVVFSATEAARIGLDLCRAVSAVHAAGLLHRDIKAQNVMIADDGRVVLMDFGTGRELDDNSSSDLAGTPLYVAPEVLRGEPATIQSDVYSLGVLLYHLVTGSYPVQGRTIGELRLAHEQNKRIGVRASRPDVRLALARVIERASDPQPGRRYDTVDALARDLVVLQRRPGVLRLWYGLAAAAVVLVVVLAASEARARLAGDHSSLGSRLVGVIAGALTSAPQPFIAVLPFKNSRQTGSGLLVDALTAGIIQQLGNIDGLKVTSQQSSFMLRDKQRDLAGKQLGANLFVEGDAELSAGTLVIRAELLRVAGGDPLWHDTLTREVRSVGDLTGVLTEITGAILDKLRLPPGPAQRRYTTDLVTYEKYLRARQLRAARGWVGSDAVALFKDVIQQDSSFAPAQAALASTYGALALLHPTANMSASSPNAGDYTFPPSEAALRMEPLAKKAIEIDPTLAEAHAAMGFTYALEYRWVDAEASFRRGIGLDPTISAVYGDFVFSTLLPWGRLDDALDILETALQADPLSLDLRRTLAHVQLLAGRYDDSLRNCQRVVDVDPDFPFAELFCIRALIGKGRMADALDRINKHPNLDFLSYFQAITGQRAEAEAAAARFADLPVRQCWIYAALGDVDRAFEAFARLGALNPLRAAALLNDPEFAALRGDPRAQEFRRKMAFPR